LKLVGFHEAEFSPALAAYLIALSDAAREQGYSVVLLTEPGGVEAVRRAISGRRPRLEGPKSYRARFLWRVPGEVVSDGSSAVEAGQLTACWAVEQFGLGRSRFA
jgi:hypothetical protein